MKRAVLLGFLGIGLSACVGSGPEKLSACLSDTAFMPRYMASAAQNRVMVGGIGKGGEPRCYWSEGKSFSSAIGSEAWRQCKATAADCTVIAQGDKVIFNAAIWTQTSRLREPVTGPTPPDQVAHAAWYLIGQFAEGFAMGLGGGVGLAIGHDLMARTVSAPAAGASPTGPAYLSETPGAKVPQTLCTPTGGAINGYPSYICR